MLAALLLVSLLPTEAPPSSAAATDPTGVGAPALAPDAAPPPPLDATPPPAQSPAASAPAATAPADAPGALPKADAKVEGVDGLLLKGAQLAACGGVYMIAGGATLLLSYVPIVGGCVGCASCLLMPAAYGTTVTAVGNFLGARQAPLLWPIVTMYIGSLATSLAAISVAVGTFVVLGLSGPTLVQAGNPALLLGAFFVPIVATVGVSLVGMIATGVISTFVWDANAVPKTEEGQFQLAFTDMNAPFFGGKPADATATPAPPAATTPAPKTSLPALPRLTFPMAY